MTDLADLDALVSAKHMAAILGLTTARLRQLEKDGVIHKAARGKYRLGETITDYLGFLKRRAAGSAADAAGAALANAKAREINLRVARREAHLIDIEDVERFHRFSSALYRRELSGLGAAVTADPIVAGQIDAALNAALDRYDRRFREAIDRLRRGEDPLEP
ncbi:hypothetical protein [Chelativorans intermedius]|uniref:DNA-binding protein n=1 Tax=Chelativorans intermedius TaxID=515947 RepID=A0ABV6D7L8_9HYPH|nr:hypothetical protein [Chelativorans intermedius]MCT8999221.1 hypothetical protein [Chelativorans intermedius]